MDTISWQQFEGAFVCVSALVRFAFSGDGIAWWLAAVLFFAPDISFAGYLDGSNLGAVVYNLVQVYAFGAVLLAIGVGVDAPVVAALGALWMAHPGFDRMLGYGLKSPKGWQVDSKACAPMRMPLAGARPPGAPESVRPQSPFLQFGSETNKAHSDAVPQRSRRGSKVGERQAGGAPPEQFFAAWRRVRLAEA